MNDINIKQIENGFLVDNVDNETLTFFPNVAGVLGAIEAHYEALVEARLKLHEQQKGGEKTADNDKM